MDRAPFSSHIGLGARFGRVVHERGGAVALRYPDGREVSYSQLGDLVQRVATGLLKEGVKPREVVAIVNRKSPEALAAMLACNALGILYTNLDPKARRSVLAGSSTAASQCSCCWTASRANHRKVPMHGP